MQVSVALPVSPESVPLARQLVASASIEAGYVARVADIRLLASEIVTNAIRHAGLDRSDFIWLGVDASSRKVRVVVADSGPGFDPATLKAPSPMRPGGMGLFLMQRLSDAWGVVNGGATFVWFEFRPKDGSTR